MERKVVFGFSAISKETPEWAKWVFRVVFILTTVAVFILASDPGLSDAFKVRAGVYLNGFEMLIFGLSKMFGYDLTTESPQNT